MAVNGDIERDNIMLDRPDLLAVAQLIKPDSRILDLGCGDGVFLKYLQDTKNVSALGIEINQEAIGRCIANGVPVIQGNLNSKLDFADDGSFDYVILSRTMQEVMRPDLLLSEIVRVGDKAIVSFLNFGHLSNRIQLLLSGSMPMSGNLPHEWFETPNIHLGTLKDLQILCRRLNINIIRQIPLDQNFSLFSKLWPNLFAHSCVMELQKKSLGE